MGKIKAAIVGVGGKAPLHIEAYNASGRAEVYALCDVNSERLAEMGERYGVTRLYTDEVEMLHALPEIDAISVCTWNSAHKDCTIAALNAGKHVLCEKPMAINAEEAKEMMLAAERNEKLLMIGFLRRFGNDSAVARDMIRSGRLGNPYYAKASYLRRNGAPGRWFCDKSCSGGGPLIDLGVHVIDLARYLMGNPRPVSVYASTYSHLKAREGIKSDRKYLKMYKSREGVFNCEDLASCMIRFEGGAVLFADTSFSLNIGADKNSVEVFGDKGGIRLENGLSYYGESDGYLVDVRHDYPTALDSREMFYNEISHFLDCIIDGKKCISPAIDGYELMRIVDAIYTSAETKREVIIG